MRTWKEYQKYLEDVYEWVEAKNIKVFKASATDRIEFKECRRRWHFGSLSCMRLESKMPALPLHFGTAIHAALEAFYCKKDPVKEFIALWQENLDEAREMNLPEENIMLMEEHLDLGVAMLEGYQGYAKTADTDWEVLNTELEWEFPLVESDGTPLVFEFNDEIVLPMVVGRFDLIVREKKSNHIMVVDHKTSCMKFDSAEIDFNDQLPIYIWAARKIFQNENIQAVWNQLRKKAPTIPKVLKSGGLSKDKSMDTTYDIYLKEIEKQKLNVKDYQKMLDNLHEKPQTFFERAVLYKSQAAIDQVDKNLRLELMEMIRYSHNIEHCFPYPNRDCVWKCDYKMLCRQLQIGANIDRLIERHYQPRKLTGVYVSKHEIQKETKNENN